MLNQRIKKIILPICLSISLNQHVFANNAPFSNSELENIQTYLLKNIVDENNPFIKKDNQQTIIAIPGSVLASPSNKGKHFSQDYQFHWTRDAAITMQEIVELYSHASASEKPRLKKYLMNYVKFEQKAQQQISKKGEETLGQPKFNLDGTIWEGTWMRPQNDGPALRAITMIAIANSFIHEDEKYVHETLLPMIMIDLNYIVGNWQHTSFDLWEEVNDREHFFTKMVQRKALINAVAFLQQINGTELLVEKYRKTADKLTTSLLKHWNANRGYLAETIDQQYFKGGGVNTSIILGVLLGEINQPDDAFALDNDKVMSSIFFIRNAFSTLYKINLSQHELLVGRYPNDIYDGNQFIYGNPWILTSNALAEYYYRLAAVLIKQGKIVITKNNLEFFKQLDASNKLQTATITASAEPKKFNQLISALVHEGDNILESVKRHGVCYSPKDCYHFAEQIDRTSGKQTSAKDLTWGYASLLTAMQARTQIMTDE